MRKLSGFTLVEMLVVIAVIGILASVIYASFGGARDQARNKALQSELKEVQLALEVFKAQNGNYPEANNLGAGAGCAGSGGGSRFALRNSNSGSGQCGQASLLDSHIVGLVPEFIAGLPHAVDSGNSNCVFVYRTEDSATPGWYKFTAENCFAGAENAGEGIGVDEEFSICPSSCSSSGCGDFDRNDALDTYDPTDTDFYESMAVYSAGGQCE